MRIRYVLAVLLLLAGCASREPISSPRPATSAQIDLEMTHLQHTFFTDPCMAKLRQAAPELKPGAAQQGGQTLYAVEFAPNTAVRDGLAYQLHVKQQGRIGYLYVSDGTAGSWRIHGPMPLWNCLQAQLR
ncbi:MAG: hypothetical protein O9318_10115 [Hylemonella sp.]|uniref:hypothetical protein n=1 Tax=Hylemonella sp. TaxID=2066020 RepID=UPI0022BAD995|nr:hypothetical protein [Hylemonella sp.]MCZ8252813.1 hypothetical protein [Hylemonella sp.]